MSAREAVATALRRIEEFDTDIGALLDVDAEDALRRAAELDAADERGPLHGVPFVLKANMCLAGRPASCASRILEGYRPPYTATFVQRLIDAGALPIAIANMDEFAFGSSGEHSSYGSTRNPWDLSRAPGGSSSGSAAAVAARFVPFALGSDTGGSVRQPAALCGVTGFKPTYGRVSRYGLIAFGSSLDAVGVLATDVGEVERVLGVISGADPLDATCAPRAPFEPERVRDDLRGVRVGVPREYLPPDLDSAVRARTEEALDVLRSLGAELIEVELPTTRHAIAAYYVVATAEASSNLARFDGVRFGPRAGGDGSLQGMFAATRAAHFGPEAIRRILLGTYVLSSGYYEAWYQRALKVRRLIQRDFQAAFERVDVLVGPTSPITAFRLGEKTDDPVAMYLCDALTVPTNLAGLPAVSVPCGFASDDGVELPVGLQWIGPAFEDARVLATARCFQRATHHHERVPPLVAGGVA